MDRLPTELLVKVFEHLDYPCHRYTLRRVNKRFQSILITSRCMAYGHGYLDQLLFRDSPKDIDARVNQNSILHPIFQQLDWKSDYQIHQIGLIYNNSGGSRGRAPLRLVDFDTICRRENATSPAVTQIHIVNEDQDIFVEEGSGIHSAVTVMDVVKGVDKMLCKIAEWGGYNRVWQP